MISLLSICNRSHSLIPLLALAVVLGAGCASSSVNRAAGPTQQQILLHEDVKGRSPEVFQAAAGPVHQAAERALVFVGCELKQNQEFYISGRRPNKMGLFVGSGGETVEVFIYPASASETHVWVDTDLSFVGIAGQQEWNERVIAEMKNILAESAQAK